MDRYIFSRSHRFARGFIFKYVLLHIITRGARATNMHFCVDGVIDVHNADIYVLTLNYGMLWSV